MRAPAAVVIAHYNERPEEPLDYLLWQLEHIEAGEHFDVYVIVNRDDDGEVKIAAKYPKVRFIYRANTGYNIGAWDFGWRSAEHHDFYVFLQDECLIARKHWLRSYMRKGRNSLIGESLVDPAETWEQLQRSYEAFYTSQGVAPSEWDGETGTRNTPDNVRRFLQVQGIVPQRTMRHLRSLILACPGSLLAAVDGFPIGLDYRDAVGAEVGISQKVLSSGFSIKQVGLMPFSYVLHPQWMSEFADARTPSGFARRLWARLVPTSARLAFKALRH